MSRETDSPSPHPQTGGGAAYPQGTEPYGTPAGGAPGESAERSGAQSGEPKTETTLTTRIRINIPGSRPIPPVVVRKPVGERDGDAAQPGGVPGAAPDAPGGGGGVPGGPGTPAGGVPRTAGTANGAPAAPGPSAANGASANGGAKQTSSWFAPRKPPTPSGTAGAPGAPGADARAGLPGQRTDTPPHGFPGPTAPTEGTGPLGVVRDGPAAGPGGTPPHGFPAAGPGGTPPHGFPAAAPPPGGLRGPDGPTTGPAAGDSLLPPGFRQHSEVPGPSGHPDTGQHPVPGAAAAPEPPQAGDPSLDLGGPAPAHREHVSGDTLVSGIPRVPADAGRPSGPFDPSDPFDDHDGREEQADHGDRDEPEPRPAPARRGRSKLVLLGVAAVGALGIAYGAGLLLDHADVPNGTTVLGVGIGGTSKEEAVDKLEAVLGERAEQPLVLDVEGKRTTLKPSVAGLAFDTETTVDEAAGRDYNPVSVIGSLFGGTRVAEPALTVDEEKLAAALKGLTAQGSGGAREGTVTFTDGKAVGVPGKPYKQVDVAKSTDLLEDAYRRQIATGSEAAVTLPVSLKQPRIGQEEIDRAIREFGRPAMSGLVTVRAGDRSIPFSPERSLPKFLSMKPVGDKLVDTYDLKVLEQLYGSTFDGVLVARGNGTKTPVTPQDVAGALREALRQTDPAKRVGVIELDPQ